jgi:hypothetical protein
MVPVLLVYPVIIIGAPSWNALAVHTPVPDELVILTLLPLYVALTAIFVDPTI